LSKSTAPPAGWGVWTWPNLVTAVRLAGIPLFCYLLLATEYYWQAAAVLAVGGGTDWVDGQLARRLNQVSRLGRLLDPMVDRLYILTALLALTYTGLLPWLFTLAILARETVLVSLLSVLRWFGYPPLQVHFLGKTATTVVFASLPVLGIARRVETNAYWIQVLERWVDEPRRIENARQYRSDYAALTAEDVRQAMARWVADDGDWSMLVLPARGEGRGE
jgi:cardiolipin synthase